jgi:NAD(P)-dependent dehydrogenase (short-subunit alcohol dehydrogenase family)
LLLALKQGKEHNLKIIVIGATGTIGSEVAKALERNKHEVIRASRSGAVKAALEDAASLRAMFREVGNVDAVISCAGNAAFKPFADLSDADYEIGLRSKLMGQVSLARIAKDALLDGGSITLTTPCTRCREALLSLWSTPASKGLCAPRPSKCRASSGLTLSAHPG